VTAKGNAKVYTSALTNTTVNMETEFLLNQGVRYNDHAGFWLTNLDVTAANILWFRDDNTAATVEGDDCWVLRPGERCQVRKTSFISFIAAAGTPKLLIAGDKSGLVYS